MHAESQTPGACVPWKESDYCPQGYQEQATKAEGRAVCAWTDF